MEYAHQTATAGHEPVGFGQYRAWRLVEAHPIHQASGVGGDAPGIDGIGLAPAQAGGGIDLGGVFTQAGRTSACTAASKGRL